MINSLVLGLSSCYLVYFPLGLLLVHIGRQYLAGVLCIPSFQSGFAKLFTVLLYQSYLTRLARARRLFNYIVSEGLPV